ncbi:hypothetical protein Hanom_Chr10g00958591 [Helianthus anomalus]
MLLSTLILYNLFVLIYIVYTDLPRNYHNWVADYKLARDGWYGSNHYDGWENFCMSKLGEQLIDRFFVHQKLKNILPTKHVTITAFPNHTWLVVMEKHGQFFLYDYRMESH